VLRFDDLRPGGLPRRDPDRRASRGVRPRGWRAALAVLFVAAAGCGKKGPPLPPLNLVPDRPPRIEARVAADTVYLTLTVPTRNATGQGPLALDHLEVYAVTVDKDVPPPANRDVLTNAHLIARIPVRPPADPDAAEAETPAEDARPAPGDTIVFAERLTPALLTPEIKAAPGQPATARGAAATAAPATPSTPPVIPPIPPDAVPATSAGTGVVSGLPPGLVTSAAAAEAAGAPPAPAAPAVGVGAPGTTPAAQPQKPPSTVTRAYVVRGVTRKGRPGTPSARMTVPVVMPPPPPAEVSATFSETAVTIAWHAPADTPARAQPLTYNVYPASETPAVPAAPGLTTRPAPLNEQPIDALSLEHGGAEPGKQQCFVVRSVEVVGSIPIESTPSDRVCVTPEDRFPPKPPAGLAAVATAGAVNLIWDANSEPDLAGYVVLRGEAPGDTLQPLTPEPIRETRFRDTTATPGVRYVYAIVAVDRTGNRSAASPRVEETAR
jgi:hypothetical protein